jgi:large subunit ribosomal protein L29
MKQEVVRELSTPELIERLDEERLQLNKLKMNHAVSPLENPNKIKAYRRTVARLVTELHRRKLESAAANKANK